jgi:hypothetical protein
MAVVAVLLFLLLYDPGLPYRVKPPVAPPESPEFFDYLSAIVNARPFPLQEI